MPLLTPPPTIRSSISLSQPKSLTAPTTPATPPFRVSDIGTLLLIGEPDSGYRGSFDVHPGGSIIVGRPSHGHKHTSPLAYFPSRAVSRTHAVITIHEDGVYITHLKPTNLTWRAVDNVWTPMRVGERAKLAHKDILCFGTAPKSRSHGNKVDAPFIVSVAFVPKGDEVSWTKYKFVKRTIHRAVPSPSKTKEMDSSMQLLLNDMSGLNVSLDATVDDQLDHSITKRKRSSMDASEDNADTARDRANGRADAIKQMGKVAEDTFKKRRLPERRSKAYCEDVVDLPGSLDRMSISTPATS